MIHGWPGSIIELLETVDPLTNPTAHGASAADAFDLVLPSIPGYGFSSQPTEIGLGEQPHRAGLGRSDAPRRPHRFVAQGGDVGAVIADNLGRLAPPG